MDVVHTGIDHDREVAGGIRRIVCDPFRRARHVVDDVDVDVELRHVPGSRDMTRERDSSQELQGAGEAAAWPDDEVVDVVDEKRAPDRRLHVHVVGALRNQDAELAQGVRAVVGGADARGGDLRDVIELDLRVRERRPQIVEHGSDHRDGCPERDRALGASARDDDVGHAFGVDAQALRRVVGECVGATRHDDREVAIDVGVVVRVRDPVAGALVEHIDIDVLELRVALPADRSRDREPDLERVAESGDVGATDDEPEALGIPEQRADRRPEIEVIGARRDPDGIGTGDAGGRLAQEATAAGREIHELEVDV